VRPGDVASIVRRNVAASGTAKPLAYIRSYPSGANKNQGMGTSYESEEWYKAVTISADCPKKVRYFADKLSTKMV